MNFIAHFLAKLQPKPRTRPVITSDSSGFDVNGTHYEWSSISKIWIQAIDLFTTDEIELNLETTNGFVVISEGFEGYSDFISILASKVPSVVEPIEFLSHHAFSLEVFEIQTSEEIK